ncbi:unnamed protein product [Durusdinium trenchii]|uniref:Uncharacterized protein n=1 Tax=Durusdinium trenchii TaxID=1381693 RepID=A0ABP0RLR2_9DINO
MPETNDRVEMPLDEVIKKDWTGDSKPRGGKGGKVLGRGKAAGRGRGLVRRNPIMTKVRRTPAKGAVEKGGKGKGRFHWVPKGHKPVPDKSNDKHGYHGPKGAARPDEFGKLPRVKDPSNNNRRTRQSVLNLNIISMIGSSRYDMGQAKRKLGKLKIRLFQDCKAFLLLLQVALKTGRKTAR